MVLSLKTNRGCAGVLASGITRGMIVYPASGVVPFLSIRRRFVAAAVDRLDKNMSTSHRYSDLRVGPELKPYRMNCSPSPFCLRPRPARFQRTNRLHRWVMVAGLFGCMGY